jgi:hypothetical protein
VGAIDAPPGPTLGRARSPRVPPAAAPAVAPRPRRWAPALLAITVLALCLRFTALRYGLPFHYHWDEPTIMNRAVRMGGGDLNPHFFYYPSLLMYLLLAVQGPLYAVGHVLGIYPSPDSFLASYLSDGTSSYLAGRALVAALGVASIPLSYAVGRRFLSRPAALVGALLLAVSPVHVSNSHFATNDTPMAFFVLLAYLALWNVYSRGRERDYLIAGAAIGLGMATKYLPVVLLLSLALSHAFRLRNQTGTWRSATRGLRWVAAGGATALVVFFLASPYVLLDWRAALHDYGVQSSLSSAAGCAHCTLNFVPYLTHTLGWSIGWPAYLLALAGLASLTRMRGEQRLRALLLASFPLLLFLMVGSERQAWARWLVPIAPFACLAAGAVLCAVLRRVGEATVAWRTATARSSRCAAAVLAVAVVAAPAALTSVRFDRLLLAADPRTQAVEWFESSVPAGTTIAVQPMLDRYFLTAQVRTDTQLRTLETWVAQGRPNARRQLEEAYGRRPVYHEATFSYSLDALRAHGVRFVLLSSAHYHQIDPVGEDRFYSELTREATLAGRFVPSVRVPDADDYPVAMPTITIYALPVTSPPA